MSNEEPTGKFIKMSDRVWEALARDAERCRRSVTKQMEAIFSVYYGLDDVDLGDVVSVRETASPYMVRGANREAVQEIEGIQMSHELPHMVKPRRSGQKAATAEDVQRELDKKVSNMPVRKVRRVSDLDKK